MFTILCTLLMATPQTSCGCPAETKTTPHMNKTANQQEINLVVPTPQCEKFKNISGKHANIMIAAAYHHDAVAGGKKEKKIYVSHASIVTKDGKTTLQFFVSKTANKVEVEKKVKEGFEKLCQEEKSHLAKPEKEQGKIRCWFNHKYDAYMQWIKTKWNNVHDKFSQKDVPATKKG